VTIQFGLYSKAFALALVLAGTADSASPPAPPGALTLAAHTDRPCPPNSTPALASIRNSLNGRYVTGGKSDSVVQLAFPTAPTAGSTLDQWMQAHSAALLSTLSTKLTPAERGEYQSLETQKCQQGGVYCRIAVRQQAIQLLLKSQP
jgi:hypothetical protein